MIDARFSWGVLSLIILAAIPTTMHSYLELRLDDGLRANAVSRQLLELDSETTDRPADWIRSRYGSEDWFERMYGSRESADIQVFVARSHDPKLLYHHPEQAIAKRSRTGNYATEFRNDGIVQLGRLGGLPVHVLRGRYGEGLAVYSLHYNDSFISNPYLFQIRSAAGLLVSPSRPMTLFFVHDRTAAADLSIGDAHVTDLLVATIESFLSQR